MKNLLTNKEKENFKTDGAIVLRKKLPTTIVYFDEVRKGKKREKVVQIK